MSNDRFTETTSTGWFSRIGSSITGVLVGLVFVLASTALLWWNEGRSVKTAKGLAEGAQITVEARPDAIDTALDGKLVHVTGTTSLTDPAKDDQFNLTAPDLVKLHRNVEIFQWVEETKETTKTKVGGSEEKVTEYLYTKKWDSKLHDSSEFRHPQDHENPKPLLQSAEFQAQKVNLGAFRLPDFLHSQWTSLTPHPLPDLSALPAPWNEIASVQDQWLVLSKTPQNPALGDARLQFESLKTGDTSLLARQKADTFEEYITSQGTSIARITSGVQSKEAMFAAAQSENTFIAWLLRLVGFIVMFVGTALVFKPLKVLADVLPLAGRIVGAGTGFIAFLLSFVGSTTIIALSWLWFRPLLGIALLALALGGLFLIKKAFKPKTA